MGWLNIDPKNGLHEILFMKAKNTPDKNDSIKGEVLVAFIQIKHGLSLDANTLGPVLADKLAKYKLPADYIFIWKDFQELQLEKLIRQH